MTATTPAQSVRDGMILAAARAVLTVAVTVSSFLAWTIWQNQQTLAHMDERLASLEHAVGEIRSDLKNRIGLWRPPQDYASTRGDRLDRPPLYPSVGYKKQAISR
jgi:hypothetical protein